MKAALGQVLAGNRIRIAGAPEGLDARLLAELAAARSGGVLHLARDDARMARLIQQVRFFAPALEVLAFPAWDCLPYDRVSPNGEVVSRRVDALSRLSARRTGAGRLVVATVNAAIQRSPPRGAFK
ncbi:MAG: transcription-repair coupling factor, partial [Alphaproteobacteria bacterium]|nr:transcription-repair coupling factor [Alphaproteobacteria bacterium]